MERGELLEVMNGFFAAMNEHDVEKNGVLLHR